MAQRPFVIGRSKTRTHKRAEEKLGDKAHKLAQRLADAFESFLKNPYTKYFDPDRVKAVKASPVLKFWENLIREIFKLLSTLA